MRKILLAIALLSSTFASAQTTCSIREIRNIQDDGYIFVAAHRADWKYAPENSLQGLKNAIFFGADLIETDVRQTKDGHFIMMHDATVDRMTNGTGTISEMTLDEIIATIHSHPTVTEAMREAALQAEKRAIHTSNK